MMTVVHCSDRCLNLCVGRWSKARIFRRDQGARFRCFCAANGAKSPDSRVNRARTIRIKGGAKMHKFSSALAVLTAAIALAPGAQAQTKITIGIPTSPPNIVHMPAIVAKELGLYKKAGLDVDIV